jgi:predicted metalloprotease with PDZ domain
MNRLRKSSAASVLAIVLTLAVSMARATIDYTIKPVRDARQYEVTVSPDHVNGSVVRFQIPVWSPGAYIIANFASNIADVSATVDGKPGTVTHPDPQTWEVDAHGGKSVALRYVVNNADVEWRDGRLKRTHISGPRTYMYVVGRKQEPVRIAVLRPAADLPIICNLDAGSKRKDAAEADYVAKSYDVMADAPVEMGDFADDVFQIHGIDHHVVLYGNYASADRAKLKEYCRRVAETEEAFFGDIPFHRYVFFFRSAGANQDGAGGLEHLGATEIGMRGVVGDRLRSVIAHEFFHLWNVKRIRPFVLGPFDYVNPPHTSNLWWSEGVTSYYGDLLSRRAGINTDQEYLKHLADTIALLQNNASRLKVTADESSYKVWDRGGSQGFGGLSYYTKGELIGLCLDMRIRHETGNRRSLDDVIRALYIQCGRGNGPGFSEDDIRKTVNKVAGKDLSSLYGQLARSTEEMPFTECLGYAGLKLRQATDAEVSPDTGMVARADNERKAYRVRVVIPGGPAEAAGIRDDDVIMAIDGAPVDLAARPFGDARPGDHHKLTLDRGGSRVEVEYTVGASKRRPWIVEQDAAATPEQMQLRASWLNARAAGS